MSTDNVSYDNGCVKWFNSRHKYGFITVLSEGEHKNVDLFVHQSNIITKEPCYRFLVAGENVKFEIKKTDNEKHAIQTVNVSGLNNVALKCETPRPPRDELSNNNNNNGGGFRGRDGFRGRGGFNSSDNNGGFRSSDGNGGFRGNGSVRGNGNGFRGRGSFRGNGGFRGNSNSTLSSDIQNIDINKA